MEIPLWLSGKGTNGPLNRSWSIRHRVIIGLEIQAGEFPAPTGEKRAAPGKLTTVAVFKTQTYSFQTETDKAKVNVWVTDFGSNFIIDISCDQSIQGWLLKRQSTREVFLKGGAPTENPYKCRIRVDRSYIKDFGLTVYVTQDSDPAFVQLY